MKILIHRGRITKNAILLELLRQSNLDANFLGEIVTSQAVLYHLEWRMHTRPPDQTPALQFFWLPLKILVNPIRAGLFCPVTTKLGRWYSGTKSLKVIKVYADIITMS